MRCSFVIFGSPRQLVDPIVLSRLFSFLRSIFGMEVHTPSRGVALVRPDKNVPGWFLLCSSSNSITLSLLAEDVGAQVQVLLVLSWGEGEGKVKGTGQGGDMVHGAQAFPILLPILCTQAHPSLRDITISLGELDLANPEKNSLALLTLAVNIFLQQEHSALLDQVAKLLLCPKCMDSRNTRSAPGSFLETEVRSRASPQSEGGGDLWVCCGDSPMSLRAVTLLSLVRFSCSSFSLFLTWCRDSARFAVCVPPQTISWSFIDCKYQVVYQSLEYSSCCLIFLPDVSMSRHNIPGNCTRTDSVSHPDLTKEIRGLSELLLDFIRLFHNPPDFPLLTLAYMFTRTIISLLPFLFWM